MTLVANEKPKEFLADLICQDRVVAQPENLIWVFRRSHVQCNPMSLVKPILDRARNEDILYSGNEFTGRKRPGLLLRTAWAQGANISTRSPKTFSEVASPILPNFFTSRVLSTVRIWSRTICLCFPWNSTGTRVG